MSKSSRHLSSLYYRNGYLLVMTIIVLLVAGLSAISNLPRIEDPRITQRGATVLTFLPGASAERIEALINKKIEDALEEISDIKKVESTARSNVSSISITLQDSITSDTNEEVFSKIRSRLQDIQNDLPQDATIPFLDDERGAVAYSYIVGINWDNESSPPMNILQRVALDLKDQMLGLSGTELVRIFGGVNEEIVVTPSQSELIALGMSATELSQIIRNSDSKVSAGQVRGEMQNLRIELNGSFASLERIRNIPIQSSPQGSALKIGDIATVSRGYENPPAQIGLKDGKRTLYVAVRTEENLRLDIWNNDAEALLERFRSEYNERINIENVFVQNDYTEARLADLVGNLLAGALIVIVIVFLTMGWKSGLIVGTALPLSIAGALFSLSFYNQGIHQMSIFGMIVAIGLLIDNAIVMSDEVRKELKKGVSRLEAMENAVRHLFIPLLASTLTTVLGFMPIFLLPGSAGDFVSPIAISVVMALVFSFFIAVTVIPALSAKFVSPGTGENESHRWWQSGVPTPKITTDFFHFLLRAMNKPKRFALIAIVPAVFGFAMMSTMDMEFFPAGDRDMFEIQVWKNSDSAINSTEKTIADIDSALKALDGVKQTHWLIGASTPPVYYNQVPTEDNNSAYAQAVVVAESEQRAITMIEDAQELINGQFPQVRAVVRSFSQGPPSTAPVAFRILGPNLDTLRTLGEDLRRLMHQHSKIVHTRASISGGEGKLWLQADEAEAELAGLSLRDIALQYQANLEGVLGGSILEDVEELPVRVRLSEDDRNTIADIANLPLNLPEQDRWLPASALGYVELKPEIPSITRFNGQRVNTIYAYITQDAAAISVAGEIAQIIDANMDIPRGYSVNVAGDTEEQSDAIGNLLTYAPILVVMIITTIILTFKSGALALIVGLVALCSVGLGMLALKISGYPLGFNPLIGSIGLAGVAINGTIVVIAAILANEKAKLGNIEAIVKETFGCGRHLISTTLTTIGGFIPLLVLSGGSFWPPLSVVIAGGIGFSLILAMFFTPLAYKVFADFHYRDSSLTLRHAKSA
ncbi:efflux RND transporter permease subunit [Alteromonas sp. P256]|uniref:efflux RND transporter permease subunit n=1 Tax=Alteromonas sp. P256 TaxID=3117399 RepID=UPI002FDF0E36